MGKVTSNPLTSCRKLQCYLFIMLFICRVPCTTDTEDLKFLAQVVMEYFVSIYTGPQLPPKGKRSVIIQINVW